jgi:hypothetical protein
MPTEIKLKALHCKSDSYLFLFRPLQFLISLFFSKNFNNRQISDVAPIKLSGERRPKAA